MQLVKQDTPSDRKDEGTKIVGLRFGAIGVGLVGLYLLYQLVWTLVSIGVGAAIIGVLGLGFVAGIKALPLLGQKWENRLLATRKQEARKNPIEQAENDYLRRSEQYQVYKSAIEAIGAQVTAFRSRLEKTRREKPNYDLKQETAALEKMQLFYDNRKQRLGEANTKLILFKDKIEEARTKWDFQLEANATIRALNATDRESKINEILTEVAFDSVQREFDTIFARLDVDAAELNSTKQLNFGGKDQSLVLDVSKIEVPQFETVAR
jgi:hypothetical protein